MTRRYSTRDFFRNMPSVLLTDTSRRAVCCSISISQRSRKPGSMLFMAVLIQIAALTNSRNVRALCRQTTMVKLNVRKPIAQARASSPVIVQE